MTIYESSGIPSRLRRRGAHVKKDAEPVSRLIGGVPVLKIRSLAEGTFHVSVVCLRARHSNSGFNEMGFFELLGVGLE
ncbi:hypothetical protein L596_016924 [Steinernema carpocapsae]|uniref:Uncharacterized protein n=1 Tax=Steinernema carpocapsae TaxID=34508 RepID=A0A4U5NKK7_STECR|nr:hypothetical protein L596_016924 [Steinernema carpocapsae]